MADFLTPEQRSAAMAKVKSKDTSIELEVRRAAYARGLRYRLHARDLPGRPDMVFRKAKVAVFLDGDFWHGRDFERSGPKLSEAWRLKIERNIERDRTQDAALRATGWTVLRFWQSEIRRDVQAVVDRIELAVKALR